jgi:alpha-tubulin suppressor-like RCC1 family protein
VYAWGSNSEGRSGVGNSMGDVSHSLTLLVSLQDMHIKYIACGGNFSYAITSTDQVYSWGGSCGGATGALEVRQEPELVPVLCNKGVQRIVAGYHHVLVLLGMCKIVFLSVGNGVCMSGGGNGDGQLGDKTNKQSRNLKNVEILEDIIVQDISACASQSFAMW